MNTAEPRLLRVEVVADLPVLWATFQRLDLPAILDRHFATPLHWKGTLTPGRGFWPSGFLFVCLPTGACGSYATTALIRSTQPHSPRPLPGKRSGLRLARSPDPSVSRGGGATVSFVPHTALRAGWACLLLLTGKVGDAVHQG